MEAVHTPGHTWGHLAIFDPRSRTMISGEATMWTAILDDEWQPAMPPTYCYVDTYLATQDRLLAMEIDLLASAHWPLQQGPAVAEYVSESRNYCLLVERTLLSFAHRSRGASPCVRLSTNLDRPWGVGPPPPTRISAMAWRAIWRV